MKKVLLLIMGVMFAGSIFAQNLVSDFQKKFEKEAEFTIVNVTPKMFELISAMSDDKDQGILQKLTGLKVISSKINVAKLYKEASRMISSSDHEELMSVADGKDNIQMFVKEKKKGVIGSLVVIVQDPEEFTMIGITGDIDLKQLATISKTFNIEPLEKVDSLQNK